MPSRPDAAGPGRISRHYYGFYYTGLSVNRQDGVERWRREQEWPPPHIAAATPAWAITAEGALTPNLYAPFPHSLKFRLDKTGRRMYNPLCCQGDSSADWNTETHQLNIWV